MENAIFEHTAEITRRPMPASLKRSLGTQYVQNTDIWTFAVVFQLFVRPFSRGPLYSHFKRSKKPYPHGMQGKMTKDRNVFRVTVRVLPNICKKTWRVVLDVFQFCSNYSPWEFDWNPFRVSIKPTQLRVFYKHEQTEKLRLQPRWLSHTKFRLIISSTIQSLHSAAGSQ